MMMAGSLYFNQPENIEMGKLLPGLKTKLTGWVVALAPAFAMLGIEIDPAAVTAWIEEFNRVLMALFALGGAAIHWFRNLADK